MSKLDKEEVVSNFTEAYKSANGKEPSIEAKGGWYSVDGGKNIRLAQLNEMIGELSTEKSAEPVAEEKKEAKPAVKTESKPATPKAAAKPATKKAKQKKSDFSVKAFWAAKITEQDKNNEIPR
jgi:hypothetical protein